MEKVFDFSNASIFGTSLLDKSVFSVTVVESMKERTFAAVEFPCFYFSEVETIAFHLFIPPDSQGTPQKVESGICGLGYAAFDIAMETNKYYPVSVSSDTNIQHKLRVAAGSAIVCQWLLAGCQQATAVIKSSSLCRIGNSSSNK